MKTGPCEGRFSAVAEPLLSLESWVLTSGISEVVFPLEHS